MKRVEKSVLLGLRVFSVITESMSVSQAAAELHVTPGAVSQQLTQLEDMLNVSLFVRKHRRLSLTPEGQALALQVNACFYQLQRALADIAPRPASNALRLKLMPSLAVRWLLPRLPSFYETCPDIQLDISTILRPEDATFEQADFVVRLGRGDWEDAESDLLFRDSLLPVCSAAMAAEIEQPSDLLRRHLLHSSMRPDGWSLWFAAHGLSEPRTGKGTRFPNAALAYEAAAKGLGIAIAQFPYVEADLAAGKLATPFPDPVSTEQGYYLLCSRRQASLPIIRKFRDWVRSLPRTLSEPAAQLSTQARARAVRPGTGRQRTTRTRVA